jgi:hypothetical protein
MKKSIIFLLTICIIYGKPVNAQVSRLLNKVSKSVTNTVNGKSDSDSKSVKQEPEPKCACELPEAVLDLGGDVKLDYKEMTISIRDDGALLVKDKLTSNFYIVKDGVRQGPIKAGDTRLTGFDNTDNATTEKGKNPWAGNQYVTASEDKFLIKFGGKTYGPYGQISDLKVTKSKDKFAAIVIENLAVSESDGKKMEEAMKNAKTDQEKMDLAMKYQQQMMEKMQNGGGPTSMTPKFVTNIAGATYNPMEEFGASLNNTAKFDDILLVARDKVSDLTGKQLLSLNTDAMGAEYVFVNTTNTKYAYYRYGTLTFSDGTTLSELFNPYLKKINGQVYLVYMYYSPKKNAIMQCKIPF